MKMNSRGERMVASIASHLLSSMPNGGSSIDIMPSSVTQAVNGIL